MKCLGELREASRGSGQQSMCMALSEDGEEIDSIPRLRCWRVGVGCVHAVPASCSR